MQKIKFLNEKQIKLNGVLYKPYLIGDLPPSFGYKFEVTNEEDIRFGIDEWFNYKGFTYVRA